MAVSPEEQARAASALVEGLQADAPIGFAVHDEQLRFVLVSHSLAAINGRPPAEHLGRRVADVLPVELAAHVEALLAGVRDSGVAHTGVELGGATHAAPDERRSWVAGYHPMELGGRRLVGVVIVDVTDRRRAQAALRRSEATLSGAQRMAGIGWWTWTARPDAVVYAPELLDLMGRDPALGGTPQSEDQLVLADPGELAAVHRAVRAALAAEQPFVRRVLARHADGGLRLLEARADLVRDARGEPVGLQGFVQDVTELARAEERQRAVAELGRQALEDLDLDALLQRAVHVVGREFDIDGVGVLEVLPRARARVRAASVPDGVTAPRIIPIEPGGIVERALTRREPVVSRDLLADPEIEAATLERRAGVRSVAVVPISGPAGPFGVLGAMSERPAAIDEEDVAFLSAIANVLGDAVERRAAEAEIARISAARGRLVAQAIDAEARARRRISESLHDGALQELLAVRNELFAMAGRGGDDDALAATQEGLTAIVVRLREVMSALHPTLLQYGGLEAALRAVAEQQRGAGAFAAHVTVEPGAAGVRDALLLSLARELLANAARHAGAARVEVAVRREPDGLALRVSDDGAGFPPERLAQALAAGSIGIASCRERVEALGGRLVVDSTPGAGTRVIARIPPPGDDVAGISHPGRDRDRA